MTNTIQTIEQFKEQLEATQQFLNSIPEQFDYWNSQLSDIDLERSDLEHYIELGNFSASEGYKAMKELQDVLRRRREIKRMVEVLTSTKAQLGAFNTKNLGQLNTAMVKINTIYNKQKNCKYKLRKRLELREKLPNELY